MKFALQSLLHNCIQRGSLALELPDGDRLEAGDGSGLPLKITLTDRRAGRELFLNPELAFGELYTDGRLLVSGGSI